MILTDKEEKFIKQYQKLYKSYLFLCIFVILFASAQLYLIFAKFIPIYSKIFQRYPEVQKFVEAGFIKCIGISFVWIAILIGVLIGNLYNYRITRSIINKLKERL